MLESMSNFDVPILKIFRIRRRPENIFQRAFYVFLGLTPLYLVKIQPDSQFHLPHQNFLDPFPSARSSSFFEPPPSLKYAGCTPGK